MGINWVALTVFVILFLFLLNSSGAIILFVYLLIGISQLVMRPKIPPEKLKVRMWGYPVLTLLTIGASTFTDAVARVTIGIDRETQTDALPALVAGEEP